MPSDSTQLNLFTAADNFTATVAPPDLLKLNKDSLATWKQRIAAYQQQVKNAPPVQGILFETARSRFDPDAIDPFALQLQPMSFYKLPADCPGQACIYFVLDNAAEIILYIGETCQSNKRWKGAHDCKRYLNNYLSLHYQCDMQAAVNMVFWWDVPDRTKPRQQVELALIEKWLPPFNKENWERWLAPFVAR